MGGKLYVVLYGLSRDSAAGDEAHFLREVAFSRAVRGPDPFWSATHGAIMLQSERTADEIAAAINANTDVFDSAVVLEVGEARNVRVVGEVTDLEGLTGLLPQAGP